MLVADCIFDAGATGDAAFAAGDGLVESQLPSTSPYGHWAHHSLHGTVRDSGGAPLPGWRLNACRLPRNPSGAATICRIARTASDGEYRFRFLPPGQYSVGVFPPGVAVSRYPDLTGRAESAIVTIARRATTSHDFQNQACLVQATC
jgi:protocatechuate 3,4-dioxygenase beta subunit